MFGLDKMVYISRSCRAWLRAKHWNRQHSHSFSKTRQKKKDNFMAYTGGLKNGRHWFHQKRKKRKKCYWITVQRDFKYKVTSLYIIILTRKICITTWCRYFKISGLVKYVFTPLSLYLSQWLYSRYRFYRTVSSAKDVHLDLISTMLLLMILQRNCSSKHERIVSAEVKDT